MEYIVIENHRTEFPNPVILKQGEKVIIVEESSEKWPGWFFCSKIDGSNKGLVPKQIIKHSTIIEDYSAKELDIDKGVIVEGIKELNGWLWLKNKSTEETGWVPMGKLEKVK